MVILSQSEFQLYIYTTVFVVLLTRFKLGMGPMPVIPNSGRWKPEDQELKAILGYRECRPA